MRGYKKTVPTPLYHQSVCAQGSCRVHGFTLLMPNSEPTICVPQLIRPSYAESVSNGASDFCSWLKAADPTWSSSVITCPPKGSFSTLYIQNNSDQTSHLWLPLSSVYEILKPAHQTSSIKPQPKSRFFPYTDILWPFPTSSSLCF